MDQTAHAANRYTNYRKVIALADHDWESAEAGKISGLNVEIKSGARFIISARRRTWAWITIPTFSTAP
jgi:hypothetical protein